MGVDNISARSGLSQKEIESSSASQPELTQETVSKEPEATIEMEYDLDSKSNNADQPEEEQVGARNSYLHISKIWDFLQVSQISLPTMEKNFCMHSCL